MDLCLTWAHIVIVGLAADVAGAVALGLAFATKQPESIRKDVPRALGGSSMFDSDFTSVGFPQALAYSLVATRGSATWPEPARPWLSAADSRAVLQRRVTHVSRARLVGILLAVGVWLLSLAAWKLYVPWEEARTRRKLDELP